MDIRLITDADVAAYRALRLEALRTNPAAFGADYEELQARPLEAEAARLRENAPPDHFILGAWDGDALSGMVGMRRNLGVKVRHKAMIWGVYVTPSARGRGVGRALMEAAIARARTIAGLEQLLLAVAAGNPAARALYLALGFVPYGQEPRALHLGDRYLDEEMMILRLAAPAPTAAAGKAAEPVAGLVFTPLTEADARTILTWRYEGPYALYNADPAAAAEDLVDMMDPANGYFSIHDAAGALIGFRCFGLGGQVPGGDYRGDAVDTGGGLRPDLTGRGLGGAVLAAGLALGRARYHPRAFRVSIAAFNRRAQLVCEHAGFRPTQIFARQGDGRPFIVLVRPEADPGPPQGPA